MYNVTCPTGKRKGARPHRPSHHTDEKAGQAALGAPLPTAFEHETVTRACHVLARPRLEYALDYLRRGFAMVPIYPPVGSRRGCGTLLLGEPRDDKKGLRSAILSFAPPMHMKGTLAVIPQDRGADS